MSLTGTQIEQPPRRQACFPLAYDRVLGEEVYIFQKHLGPMRNEFFPVARLRIRDRRGDEAKVLGVLIRADVEETLPMVYVVFVVLRARQEHPRSLRGTVAGERPYFGRGQASGRHKNVCLVPRPVRPQAV